MDEEGNQFPAKIVPHHHLLQCSLWDCQRGTHPAQFCTTPDHEFKAVSDEQKSAASIYIGSCSDSEEAAISHKILTRRALGITSGIPSLSPHILQSDPSTLHGIFECVRIENEDARSYIFFTPTVNPGRIWRPFPIRHAFGEQRFAWSLNPPPTTGRYILHCYPSENCVDPSLYWLNYRWNYLRLGMTVDPLPEAKQHEDCGEDCGEDARSMGVLASTSSVCREREEFLRLVKEEMEVHDTMVVREDVDGEKADEVSEADKVSSALMEKAESEDFQGINCNVEEAVSLARIEYTKFLRETAKKMAEEVKHSRTGEVKKTAEDLDEFLEKVRRGQIVHDDELVGLAKLFNDELTLDDFSRPRLVSMCKNMGISPFGTDAYLQHMLRKRLRSIKKDDKLIRAEGVDSRSEAELRRDCKERGMLGLVSVEEMRQQLRDWMDFSLNHSIPSSLLILSRAHTVSGRVKAEDAVRATLSSLPGEVVETVGITSLPSEDPVSQRRRKLEYLEMQEEMIKEEEEELTRIEDVKGGEEDKALKEMTIPTASKAQEQARARVLEQQDDLCKLGRALGVLPSTSSVLRDRGEFLRLVKKEMEFYNTMVEREDVDGEKAAVKAYKTARGDSEQAGEVSEADEEVSSALMEKVDGLIQNLEKEISKIGNGWQLLDRDPEGKVTPDEVEAAAMYLKHTLAKEGLQQLMSNLSKDKEGRIMVEDIVRLGRLGRLGSKPTEEESN